MSAGLFYEIPFAYRGKWVFREETREISSGKMASYRWRCTLLFKSIRIIVFEIYIFNIFCSIFVSQFSFMCKYFILSIKRRIILTLFVILLYC